MAINTFIQPFQMEFYNFYPWKAGKNRHHQPEPDRTDQDGRIADCIARNGTPDGRNVTVYTGNSAGGAFGFVTDFCHTHHLTIDNGTTVYIDHGFNKWYDRRGGEITVNNDADFKHLVDIMLHPRDPRECAIYLPGATHRTRFIFGHVGKAGLKTTVSYHGD